MQQGQSNSDFILSEAGRVLNMEAQSISDLVPRLGEGFCNAARAISQIQGKVVISGVGKSGLIASKIAATLCSTGTPAVFLHPTDAAHGDLGIISPKDVVIAISKSGETTELLAIVPTVKKLGSSLIAMVGNLNSTLARKADFVIDAVVSMEACPYDLAPTTSTTAVLALGDALAITLMRMKNFTPDDFAVFHPHGALGKRLLMNVENLMHAGERNPVLTEDATVVEIVDLLTESKLGGVNIVDDRGGLVGIITDGDVRRAIRQGDQFFSLTAKQLMTLNPLTINRSATADQAYHIMEHRASQISVLPVVDDEGTCIGILRLHDVIGGGRD